MKRVIAGLIVIIILLAVGVGYFYAKSSNPPIQVVVTPSPMAATPQPTSQTSLYCSPNELQALVTFDAGAGNIYGTINIKNTSTRNCQIIGSNFINATFTAQNLTISQQGQPVLATISLTPNQTVYSQIHYPNGPQCSDPTSDVPITYKYQISPTDSVIITSQSQTTIPVCPSLSEKTTLDVWSLSNQPVNQ